MQPGNFNNLTTYQLFPSVFVGNKQEFEQLMAPSHGDPGFLVVDHEGGCAWVRDLDKARALAGNSCAVYAAEECGPYFQQFAVAAHPKA
jgi:hypothetical protein